MKIKILIIQDTLSNYNEPVYSILSEKYDLTLAYANKLELTNINNFKIVKLNRHKFFKLYYFKANYYQFCNQFDVVIFSADLHYFSFCILPFLKKKNFKTISWTLGIRASYSLRYDLYRKKNIFDFIYLLILKKCDALIFYMIEPTAFWGKMLSKKNIFVAKNTIDVKYDLINNLTLKNTFLFVGTLYKEKKIYELIDAFVNTYQEVGPIFRYSLEIIGDGPEFNNIKSYISDNNLFNLIKLRGRIIDEVELSKYFNRSILCISPDQAGLSVLMSMGYGVPFVTRFDAITGGERLNIINNYNGIFYNNVNELIDILKSAYNDPNYFLTLGKNAREYYINNASIDIMAEGFINAIEYVSS
jgi:glycosyltransferase involved in cell wall biosynthesis